MSRTAASLETGSFGQDWSKVAVKHLAVFQSGSAIDSAQIEKDGAYPVFGGNGLRGYTDHYTHQGEFVLVGRQGALCGNVNYASGSFWASEHALVGHPRSAFNQTWFGELLRTANLGQFSTAAAQPGIAAEVVNNLRVPVPPLNIQTAIARFLDQETGRIDGLIEKKTRFIALLRGKRAAVITHAVTKGINPNAPMKDSGVEWIGQVPDHWRVTRLGYLGRSANGINIGGEAFGSGFPFVSYGDVYKNRELPEAPEGLVQSTKADQLSYSVKAGDIFFTRTSETVEEIAFPSVCMKTIENAVFAGFLIRFRPYPGVLNPNFSKFAFQNRGLRDFYAREMKLVTRASLSQGLLNRTPVPLPPIDEQEAISEFLDVQCGKIEGLIAKSERSIDLLREKRAALITAAVTGKIDVRNAA